MWLLNTTTIKLRQFVTNIPDYVILSHTWGEEEISFYDIAQPYAKGMTGYSKISGCCARAVEAGFEWAWVDTCCIDKRSSAELSEAINSMYKWYWDAAMCYAYISDCSLGNETLQFSRWFKRGWTLQELLAPDIIEFFDSKWRFIGTKSSLLDQIYAATSIEKEYLLNRDVIENATVAAKFSWASDRTATREEDMAYCLLGLVQVNMPMLYGEGTGAFFRLQLEIIKQTNEHTIFAWESTESTWHHTSIFASSPALFKNAAGLRTTPTRIEGQLATHEMTNRGLSITLPCIFVDHSRVVAVLNCTDSAGKHIGVWLGCTGPGIYRRLVVPRATITEEEIEEAILRTMHVETISERGKPEANKECSMRVHEFSGSRNIYLIATGSRLNPITNRLSIRWEDIPSFLRKSVIQDGEFTYLYLTIADASCLIFLGLQKGRPWINICSVDDIDWPRKVEENRNRFDSQLQNHPDARQRSCFRDYLNFPFEGGGRLQVWARKTRSVERLEWGVEISAYRYKRSDGSGIYPYISEGEPNPGPEVHSVTLGLGGSAQRSKLLSPGKAVSSFLRHPLHRLDRSLKSKKAD